jgi:hypothetical protein
MGQGILGFCVLLSVIMLPLAKWYSSSRSVYGVFIVVMLSSMMFESVLERQFGLAFFLLVWWSLQAFPLSSKAKST